MCVLFYIKYILYKLGVDYLILLNIKDEVFHTLKKKFVRLLLISPK